MKSFDEPQARPIRWALLVPYDGLYSLARDIITWADTDCSIRMDEELLICQQPSFLHILNISLERH